MDDFATIGKAIKEQSGAYQDLPDEVVGQAYLKKTNPLQYQLIQRQMLDAQALEQNAAKQAQDISFKQEQGNIEQDKTVKLAQELLSGGVAPADIPTDKLKQAALIEQIKSPGGYQKPMDTPTAKRAAILKQSAPVLERVSKSSELAPPGMRGSILSTLGMIPGVSGGEAEFLRRQNEGFARLIASAFASEVGVATDRDVKRWKALLPQPGDTKDERKRMLKDLVGQISSEASSLNIPIPEPIKRMAKTYGVSVEETKKPKAKTTSKKSGYTIQQVED